MNIDTQCLFNFGVSGVDEERVVLLNCDDVTFSFEVTDGLSGEGPVDLASLSDDGWGDQFCLGDLFHHLVVGSFIEENGVHCFLFDFSLGPFLLTALPTGQGGLKLLFLCFLLYFWRHPVLV